MKITDVTTAVVQANFDYVFVRVHTDEGIVGTGEAFFAPGITAIVRSIGRVLVGNDPLRVRSNWKRLHNAAGGFDGSGITFNAISGIETALWDLAGRAAGLAVVDLWAARRRDLVELYVDLHGGSGLASLDEVLRYRTPFWASADSHTQTGASFWEWSEGTEPTFEASKDRAKAAAAEGFRKLKFDVDIFEGEREPGYSGASRSELRTVAEHAAAIREAVGPDVGLAFDCHWRFDVPTALAVAESLSPVEPLWLEDPVPPQPRSLRAVASRSPIPIATGENIYLLNGFMRLFEAECLHIATPDVQKTGGMYETLLIAEVADRLHLPVAPHCIAGPVGLMAAAHVMAAADNAMCLEFHAMDVPFWQDLVVGGLKFEDGSVRVTERPGLGVDLDLDVVCRFAAPGEAVFDRAPVR